MNDTIITPSAASPWVTPVRTRAQAGLAPNLTRQGSGMSFSGYPATGALKAAAAAKHVATTLAAVRQDADGRVPPRGRTV